jgi:hypothetical protein
VTGSGDFDVVTGIPQPRARGWEDA